MHAERILEVRWIATFLIVAALLHGCGGGGGGPPTTLSGTAAKGAPISSAAMVAKDRNGTQVTGTTTVGGAYSLNVAGLTEPFLLKVTPSAGPALYSVGTQAGVVNVTPLTDMVIRNYYRTRQLDVATVFASLSASTPVPTADEVKLVAGMVKNLIADWLPARSIVPASFDIITVPFVANGTGFDAVLDLSTVTDNGTQTSLTVTSGTVSQATTVTVDSATNSIAATTSTTNGTVTTVSKAATIVPSSTNALAALRGVNAALAQMKSTFNTKGAALTAADMLPHLDAGLLHEGTGRSDQAAEIAGFGRLITVNTLQAGRVSSYDDLTKVLDVDMLFVASNAGGTNEETLPMSFKQQVGGQWLLSGNRQVAAVSAHAEMQIENDGSPGHPLARKKVNVDVRAPAGIVKPGSVSIHCPSDTTLFNNTPVPTNGTQIVTYKPTASPAGDYTVTWDAFFTAAFPANHPPPGTVLNVTVTPTATNIPETYKVVSGATTTETVMLTTTPLGNLVADVRGQNVAAAWTLPTTFRVVRLQFAANVRNAAGQSQFIEASSVGSSSTSGTLAIPATVGGATVSDVTLNLGIEGPNGERIIYLYTFR